MGWGMWGGPQTQYDQMPQPAMWDQNAANARMQAQQQFMQQQNPMMGAMGPVGLNQSMNQPMNEMSFTRGPEGLNRPPMSPMGPIQVGNQADQSPMAQQNAMQQFMANRQRMMQQRQGPGSRIIRTDQKQAPPMGQTPAPQANPMAQQQVEANRQRMLQKRMQGPGSRMVY